MKQNPERVIEALRRLLAAYPDLRVGQAIVNATPQGMRGDPFYIADDELADALDAYLERCKRNDAAGRTNK